METKKKYTGKINIIHKRYTIAFVYAGIRQYADFYENDNDNGILTRPTLSVNYGRDLKLPAFPEKCTINDVLTLIREHIDKRAVIDLINGMPADYYHNRELRELVDGFKIRLEKFKEEEIFLFFQKAIQPILKENKWFVSSSHIGMPVLAEQDENGEWDNISDKNKEFQLEYICYAFIQSIEPNAKFESKNQYSSSRADAFSYLIGYIPLTYLQENDLYYKNE